MKTSKLLSFFAAMAFLATFSLNVMSNGQGEVKVETSEAMAESIFRLKATHTPCVLQAGTIFQTRGHKTSCEPGYFFCIEHDECRPSLVQ